MIYVLSIVVHLSVGIAFGGEPRGFVYVEKGNIFLKRDGKSIKITASGRDSEPILSTDGRWVAFNREMEDKEKYCLEAKEHICATGQLWIYDLDKKSEQKLLGPKVKNVKTRDLILQFKNKAFSPDSQTVYFETWLGVLPGETWEGFSRTVHSVDIQEKTERFIAYGGQPRIIKYSLKTPWSVESLIGHLVVARHKYYFGAGAIDEFRLYSPEGKWQADGGEDPEYLTERFGIEYLKYNSIASAKKKGLKPLKKILPSFLLLPTISI